MRAAPLIAAFLAVSACQRDGVAPVAAAPEQPASPSAASMVTPPASPDAAWQTEASAYALNGMAAPDFTASINGGGEASRDTLRGRWTILAFWGLWSDDSLADAPYMQALNSAANADPELEFVSIYIPPALGRMDDALGGFPSIKTWFDDQGGAWPTAMDDGKIAEAFKITTAPVYLLIGPDLTIEGYRTELAATPDDGIKSVIRGVAEIRKEIAAPD